MSDSKNTWTEICTLWKDGTRKYTCRRNQDFCSVELHDLICAWRQKCGSIFLLFLLPGFVVRILGSRHTGECSDWFHSTAGKGFLFVVRHGVRDSRVYGLHSQSSKLFILSAFQGEDQRYMVIGLFRRTGSSPDTRKRERQYAAVPHKSVQR